MSPKLKATLIEALHDQIDYWTTEIRSLSTLDTDLLKSYAAEIIKYAEALEELTKMKEKK